MSTSRLARYSPWMARDYFLWAGVATFAIVFGFGWLFWKGMSVGLARLNDPEQTARGVRGLAGTLTGMVATLGPLIATLSITSNDRVHGYYRFLFARPVTPSGYYATKFAINGAGFLLVATALWGAFSLSIGSSLSAPAFLPTMAVSYVFIGGIVFLVSVLTRLDLLVSVLVYFVSAFAWGALVSNPTGWIETARPLISLLPPIHRQGALIGDVTRVGAEVVWKSVIWCVGYGLACFGLGVLILRRRGLAE